MIENKDYENLREEIMYSRKAQDTFTMFLYTTVITILGFAFELNNLYLFILPIAIIIPVSIKIADYRRTIAYIATYMITYLEKDSFHWETDNLEFSKKYPRKGIERIIHILENYDSFILDVICTSIFVILVIQKICITKIITGYIIFDMVLCIIAIFTCVIVFLVTKSYSDYQNLKLLKLNQWKEFKQINNKTHNNDLN